MKAALRLLAAAGTAFGLLSAQTSRLVTWRREAAGHVQDVGAPLGPQAVGSLMKPFVAKAWALAHPDAEPPRIACSPASGCWQKRGHGILGLQEALATSCNAYFRELAEATPLPQRQRIFRQESFLGTPERADQAIGLEPGLRILPEVLLEAYVRLRSEPWEATEAVRQQVLRGLREAALTGTAKGIRQRGFLAKTGTVPSVDEDPRHTTGWTLVMDEAGWAVLARLEHGTGREAAQALAEPLARPRTWVTPLLRKAGRVAPQTDVTVRLFGLLPGAISVRNLEAVPLPWGDGYIGPGAERRLGPGDRVGPGHLELHAPGQLLRRLHGSLSGISEASGAVAAVARVPLRDYVAGVLAAELPGAMDDRRMALGAAVLRFLARGPRHSEADVCDSTHCAWYIGEGPRLDWASPIRARVIREPIDPPPTEREWRAMLERAQEPGPAAWSAHCGGEPLSSQALWASGEMAVESCPRHSAAEAAPWRRVWKADDLRRAFGRLPQSLSVVWKAGTWHLRVGWLGGSQDFRYDDAHRQLAAILGWDALPSPADGLEPVPGGWEVRGRGQGHRVGLCLGS